MGEESTPRTRFERVVDNLRFRMFFTAFMCVLYLGILVLAALSFHIYPSEIYGALAYHIVLSIVTCAYSVFFLWRNLDGCTKKRTWGYFGLNLVVIIFWLAAFFALAIELGMTGGSNGPTGSFYPAIGCVVVDIFIVFMYIVNLAYIYFRQQRLFPKYAELNDGDGHAYNSQMAESATQDEAAPHAQEPEQPAGPAQAQNGYSAYGPYEGQDEYRPSGHHDPPPPRYDAESYPQRQPYQQQPSYGYHTSAYAQRPQYPAAAVHQDSEYHGRTPYSQPQNPRVSPTPYPRDSMMGYGNVAR